MLKSLLRWFYKLSSTTLFVTGFVLIMLGFFYQTDLDYDDTPIATSYSLSLGDKCEADYKQCHIHALPPVGYRAETSLNEVVEFLPGYDGVMNKYRNCTIWSGTNWTCEFGRIAMHDGIIKHNDFETDQDIYYVPKVAWKMARLHVLPLDSVRHAPPPKRAKRS